MVSNFKSLVACHAEIIEISVPMQAVRGISVEYDLSPTLSSFSSVSTHLFTLRFLSRMDPVSLNLVTSFHTVSLCGAGTPGYSVKNHLTTSLQEFVNTYESHIKILCFNV